MAAEKARRFSQEPRVAMLSFSNFGSTPPSACRQGAHAPWNWCAQRAPGPDDRWRNAGRYRRGARRSSRETYPFSTLKGGANVLIFPNLEAGNIAYKLLRAHWRRGTDRPVAHGLSKPVHVLQRGSEVNDIVHVAAMAVVDAQETAD